MAMTNHEIVLAYLQKFCAGNINALEPLFAPDLTVSGPLLQCSTVREYLDSLKQNPPIVCQYRIRSLAENTGTVAVLYDYIKPDRTMLIAQFFTLGNFQIKEMLLVFDHG